MAAHVAMHAIMLLPQLLQWSAGTLLTIPSAALLGAAAGSSCAETGWL
jgi:hypothetical protein